jgi:multiple sugar transport system ATP-binding protein
VTEIVLESLGKRFPDGTDAVRDVDLTIANGEFFVLVGPSGCGKSTLLNLIVGLDKPTQGEIRIDGVRANDIAATDRNMAMVFQNYALYPHMTVRENLAFPLRVAGLARERIRDRIARTAALLELDELLDRRPQSLSGGQRQRVAMGRAIVREPAAFLLDEPLSNLDARLRAQMRTEIARLQKQLGTTTIYVTHDQEEAMTLGDRVAVLRNGVVQQVGTPRELYETPSNLFVAAFIGSPPMNFMAAHADPGQLELPIASIALTHEQANGLVAAEGSCARGRALIAGIRPEHFAAGKAAVEASRAAKFVARVELLEWTGAEKYVHFTITGDMLPALSDALSAHLGRSPVRNGKLPLIARLSADSAAAEDHDIELMLEPDRIYLFDPVSGERVRGVWPRARDRVPR